MKYHCDLLSNSILAKDQELQKAKLMVETLQAVIQMLYNSPDKLGRTNSTASKEGSKSVNTFWSLHGMVIGPIQALQILGVDIFCCLISWLQLSQP